MSYEYTSREKEMFARKDALTNAKAAEISAGMPSLKVDQITYLIETLEEVDSIPPTDSDEIFYNRFDTQQIHNAIVMALRNRGVISQDFGKTWIDAS